jgi:hypothetical protein
LRSRLRTTIALLLAGLILTFEVGCENSDIALADVPPASQPDPVPLDKLSKDQQPPKHSSAAAALRRQAALSGAKASSH